MKQAFIADGPNRFFSSEEYQARCEELRMAVMSRHAVELSRSQFFRRLIIRCRIYQEYRRELRRITPSSQSLWFGNLIALSHKPARESAAIVRPAKVARQKEPD